MLDTVVDFYGALGDSAPSTCAAFFRHESVPEFATTTPHRDTRPPPTTLTPTMCSGIDRGEQEVMHLREPRLGL